MSFWSLIFAFLPWIVFKFMLLIPGVEELLLLKLSISVAAAICGFRIIRGLDKGIIAWGSGVFFFVSLIMVVGLTHVGYMHQLGVLSNGTLAFLTWGSVVMGAPFTLAYSRQAVDPKYWDTPRFVHKNYRITAAWGLSFTISLVDALIRQQHPEFPGYLSEMIDDLSMLGAILFTTQMSKVPKPAKEAEQEANALSQG